MSFYDVKAFFDDGSEDMFLERVYARSPEAAISEVMRMRGGDLPARRLGLFAVEVAS